MANGKEQTMTAIASNIDHNIDATPGAEFDNSPWSRAVTHIIALADQQNIRTIGITATQPRAGVSMFSQALSESYVGFGKKTLLAVSQEASSQKVNSAPQEGSQAILPALGNKQATVVSLPDLIEPGLTSPKARNYLNEVTAQFDAIVVDLPPVSVSPGRSTPGFMRFAPLCDLVFLICVTNVTPREELKDCLQQCAINDANIGGIIMNDFTLVGSQFVTP